MGSVQIEILQFWEKTNVLKGWKRFPTLEGTLKGREWRETGEFADSIMLRIYDSERKPEWIEARKTGDFNALATILKEFGCERAREVAHAIDIQRRERDFLDLRVTLQREPLGSD